MPPLVKDSRETQKFRRQLVQMVQNVGDGINSINYMLTDYVRQKDR